MKALVVFLFLSGVVAVAGPREREIRLALGSQSPEDRKAAAVKALALTPSEPLLMALMRAASLPLTESEVSYALSIKFLNLVQDPKYSYGSNWEAKASVGRALAFLGIESLHVGLFFASDKANCPSLKDAREQFARHASKKVLQGLLSVAVKSKDLAEVQVIASIIEESGNIIAPDVGKDLLRRFSKKLPELDTRTLDLRSEWFNYLSFAQRLAQMQIFDSLAPTQLRKFLALVEITDDQNLQTAVEILVVTLARIDPNGREALAVIDALRVKYSSNQGLKDALHEAATFLTTGHAPEPDKNQKAIAAIEERVKALETIPVPPYYLVNLLDDLENRIDRYKYFERIIKLLRGSNQPDAKKNAAEFVQLLWEDEQVDWRGTLQQSRDCSVILTSLAVLGIITLPDRQ